MFDTDKYENKTAEKSTCEKNLRPTLIDETAASSQCFLANPLQQEINQYLPLNNNSPALKFWKLHEKSFPFISAIAKVHLYVSAGSVPG